MTRRTSTEVDREDKCHKCFVYFLRFLKGFAILCLLLNIVAFCLVMKNGIEADNLDNQEKAFIVLSQSGLALFSIMCIIAEFEPLWFIRFVYLMHFWAGRGFSLLWLGVQTIYSVGQLVAAVKENADVDTDAMNIVGQVVGWSLISIGGLYILMGLLCIAKITGVDDESDLAVGFLGSPASRSATKSKTNITVVTAGDGAAPGVNAADIILIENMAIALGMSSRDARQMLGGKDGSKAAEKMMRERAAAARTAASSHARELSTQNQAAASAVKGAALDAESSAAAAAAKGGATLGAAADAYAGGAEGKPTSRSLNGSGGDDDDDVGSRRRKALDDDDDLEALYYGAMAK